MAFQPLSPPRSNFVRVHRNVSGRRKAPVVWWMDHDPPILILTPKASDLILIGLEANQVLLYAPAPWKLCKSGSIREAPCWLGGFVWATGHCFPPFKIASLGCGTRPCRECLSRSTKISACKWLLAASSLHFAVLAVFVFVFY